MSEPMADQREFDLSDGYNRIAGAWYPLLVQQHSPSMPVAACAYPIDMGERVIAVIRDEVQPEDHHLRWHVAGVQLHCHWQGRTWQRAGERLVFIDNAVGWVDPSRVDGDAAVSVRVAFGRPQFDEHVATMIVEFEVDEVDDAGDVVRNVRRPFRIHADGRRAPLF